MADVGKVKAKLVMEDEMSPALDKAAQNLKRTHSRMRQVGVQIGEIGTKMTQIAGPLAAMGGAAFKFSTDFSLGLVKIETLVGINRDIVQGWRDDILDLAEATGRGPEELVNAMFFVTSAGLRGQQALDALGVSARAAALQLGDTKSFADAVTSAMNAYGPAQMSAARAANVFALAVRAGKIEAHELAPVMGRMMPTASALKIPIEDVAGAMAVMSRTGLNAAEASTAVSRIMDAMLGKVRRGAKELRAVGLSYKELRRIAAQPGGLVEALRLVSKALDGQYDRIIKSFPNLRAFRGLMNLLAQDQERVDWVMNEVAKGIDLIGEGMERLAEEPGFRLQQMWATIKRRMIEFGDAITPAVEKLMDSGEEILTWVSRAIQAFADLPQGIQVAIVKIIAFGTALGPVTWGIGNVIKLVSALYLLMPKLAVAVKGVTLSFGAMAAALGAVVFVLDRVTGNIEAYAQRTFDNVQSTQAYGIALAALRKEMVDSAAAGRELNLEIARAAVEGFIPLGERLEAEKQKLAEFEKQVKTVVEWRGRGADRMRVERTIESDQLKEQRLLVQTLSLQYQEATRILDQLEEEYGDLNSAMAEAIEKTRKAIEPNIDFSEAYEEVAKKVDKVARGMALNAEALQLQQRLSRATGKEAVELRTQIKLLTTARQLDIDVSHAALKTLEDEARALSIVEEAGANLERVITKRIEQIKLLNRVRKESLKYFERGASGQRKLTNEIGKALARGGALLKQQRDLVEAQKDGQKAVDRLNNPIRKLAQSIAILVGEGHPAVQMLREMAEEFDELEDEVRKFEVASDIGDAISGAIIEGLASGEITDAMEALVGAFATLIQQQVALAVSSAIAGPAGLVLGPIIGAVAGGLFSKLAGGLFGGDDEVLRQFTSVVNLLSGAATQLEHAARDLADAAAQIRERFSELARSVGGFLSITAGIPNTGPGGAGGGNRNAPGGGVGGIADAFSATLMAPLLQLIPDLQFVVNQVGDQFHVSVMGLISGVGSSLQDAVRDMFDKFAQRLPWLIEQGVVSLEGVPKAIADVLRKTAFQTWEDLLAAIETAARFFTAAIGPIRAQIFEFFGDLRVAVSDAIRIGLGAGVLGQGVMAELMQFINSVAGISVSPFVDAEAAIEEFKKGLEGLPISAGQADRAVRRFEDALRITRMEAEQQVWGTLANWARELGVHADVQRRAARLALRIEFLKLKLTAQTLGIWRDVRGLARELFRGMLEQVNSLGNDVVRAGEDFADDVEDAGETLRRAVEDTDPGDPLDPDFAANLLKTLTDLFQPQLQGFELIFSRAQEIFLSGVFHLNQIQNAVNEVFDRWIESVKEGIREFREGLRFGPYAQGTPAQKAQEAFQDLQDAFLAILSGDLSQLDNIEQLADLALQLGSAAFGTSTQAFADLFQQVVDMLQILENAQYDVTVTEGPGFRELEFAIDVQTSLLSSQYAAGQNNADGRTNQIVGVLNEISNKLTADFVSAPV